MDHSYPYNASLTREPFLFYEMRSTATGRNYSDCIGNASPCQGAIEETGRYGIL